MKKLFILAGFLASALFLSAQNDDDKNIVITKSQKEFKFVKGNSDHPVQIREESSKIYTCNNYRTDVSVVEFYNDIETIDDVNIRVNDSKKHGIVPKYEYYNSDGVFYSDAHVCYFQLPLIKKGSTSEVTFKKTTLDPHYFTSIYFTDDQEITDQEIKLIVPSWMQLEIKEYNFKKYNVQKNITPDGDETVYTYSMKNIPAMRNESSAPGPSYFAPHILVLCKSAQPKDEKYTYFNTIKEQYEWYKKLVLQIGNDEKVIKEKTEEIIKGISGDEEKVKTIFQWVQDNVRYIAFENGIAGFKPEKAQEVLRKKYGDCKGMANLLTVMLHSINLDARRCWIGTKHIAYDYSTPSLSVDNHMICAWMNKGKPVYLDATEKYIGFGEIAERIQGRQTLIENGNQYLLEKVPVATHLQNTATEARKFLVEGNSLKGHVTQVWKGENKEWLLDALNDIKQDKQENALKQFLAEGKQNFEISNLKIGNITNYNADLKVEYDVLWKDVLTVFDKETYLDTDNRRNLDNFKIDTAKRKLPYWFSFKNNLIFETEIQIPAGKIVSTLPDKLLIKQPGYSFTAGYSNTAGKIVYKNEIILNQTEIKPENFSQWNKDIEQLTNFYNQQIVFNQKN
jgi:transglutaminase-like putative cysteine protease